MRQIAATKFCRSDNDFTCHTRRFVAATCRGDVSQRFVASCVSALKVAQSYDIFRPSMHQICRHQNLMRSLTLWITFYRKVIVIMQIRQKYYSEDTQTTKTRNLFVRLLVTIKCGLVLLTRVRFNVFTLTKCYT